MTTNEPGAAGQETMMRKFQIESKAGVVFGVYEGETKKDAFLAMLKDSGDEDSYGESHVGTEETWIVKEIDDAITAEDEPLIMEWLNADEASVDAEGDVWVAGPMNGHWLDAERKLEFVAWRAARERAGIRVKG